MVAGKRKLLIKTLMSVAKTKDPELWLHLSQTAELSRAIAEELSLPRAQVQACYLSGLLHDIGKVLIPDMILKKPAALNNLEWEEIKKHPLTGQSILAENGFEAVITKSTAQSHERIDGKGYPFGLVDKNICLEAKIVSVADAFHAMIWPRPYRRTTMHYAEAIFELQKCSDTQFWAPGVEALESIIDKGFSFEPVCP